MTRLTPSRRAFLGGAGALGLGLVTGCAPSSPGTADSEIGLRFAWWGNEFLNKQTQDVIDAFGAVNSKIAVSPEPGEWGSYWDKLATQVAANDAPDVINMDQKYIAEYGGRGALMDLSSADGLDLSTIDEKALTAGTYDGQLFGISTGQNAYSVVLNKQIFADAGVEIPDDKTWTWDDYREVAAKISKSGKGETFGTSYGVNEAYLIIWLRQAGEQLYTADGGLGATEGTLTTFFDHIGELRDSGAGPEATVAEEDNALSLEQKLFGTNRAGMTWYWTNQLGSLEATTGSDIVQLRAPSQTGSSAENGVYYKPSMFWSLSSRTKHSAEAITFLSFMINDPGAAKIFAVDRGAPINSRTADAVKSALKPADLESLGFLDSLAGELKDAPPVPPVGAGDVQNVLARYTTEVMFEQTTSAAAATAFKAEVESMIKK